jgi:hypothetical protein
MQRDQTASDVCTFSRARPVSVKTCTGLERTRRRNSVGIETSNGVPACVEECVCAADGACAKRSDPTGEEPFSSTIAELAMRPAPEIFAHLHGEKSPPFRQSGRGRSTRSSRVNQESTCAHADPDACLSDTPDPFVRLPHSQLKHIQRQGSKESKASARWHFS